MKSNVFARIKITEKINVVITIPFENKVTPLLSAVKNTKKKNPQIKVKKLSQVNIFFKKFFINPPKGYINNYKNFDFKVKALVKI